MKKLYLLLAICSICLFALVACDNQTPQETEGTTKDLLINDSSKLIHLQRQMD